MNRHHRFSQGAPISWPEEVKQNLLLVGAGSIVLCIREFETGVAAGFAWCQLEHLENMDAAGSIPKVGTQGWVLMKTGSGDALLRKLKPHERAGLDDSNLD